jgi:hypothetical protein
MATSTTTAWFPTVAEIIDEAAERARLTPASLDPAQQFSARRSLNAIFTAWQTMGNRLGLVTDKATLSLTQGTESYALPADCFDILEASLRRDSVDVPMVPISRDVYLQIPSKDVQGRPDRYYIERTQPQTLWLWQTSNVDTDVIVYNYLRMPKDVTADMTLNPDSARIWIDALFDELACRMHQKFGKRTVTLPDGSMTDTFDMNYQKFLNTNASESLYLAKTADRQRTDTSISVRFGI